MTRPTKTVRSHGRLHGSTLGFVGVGLFGGWLGCIACAPDASSCQPGTIGCECVQGTCDTGLTCSDDVCIGQSGDADTGANTTDATSTSGPESTSGTQGSASAGDSGESTAGTDPCIEAGGERLTFGACALSCVYDEYVPGTDYFEDCLPLDMVCDTHGVHGDWCEPPDGCQSDSDCGEGWKCMPSNYCMVQCDSNADCQDGWVCELEDEYDIYGTTHFCQTPI